MPAYEQLLQTYQNEAGAAREETLQQLAAYWDRHIQYEDRRALTEANQATDDFYHDNEQLYTSANETTGDTDKQLEDLKAFVANYSGELACASVIDIGCGDGERITVPMAKMLPDCSILGIDHRAPDISSAPANLSFKVGDFTDLPVEPKSVTLATAHWSVLNDLVLRRQQTNSMQELSRVLKPDGLFYFDVPTLEGEYGYEPLAIAHNAAHPDKPFGMIRRAFPGGRSKDFYIYPRPELDAMLEYHGFGIEQSEDWVTRSGQGRRTVVTRLVDN